jgi:phosphate transport system substrate-binding protein
MLQGVFMKRRNLWCLVAVIAGCGASGSCSSQSPPLQLPVVPKNLIVGVGATFPAPLYRKWIEEYHAKFPDSAITYDALGSGEGVQRMIEEVADFGASDAAMTDDEIAKVRAGIQLIPATAGSIVLAYNLPDVPSGLKLRRSTYVDIFSGKITQWDDRRIQSDNSEIKLPALPIKLAVRGEHSGTTYAFTNHLSAISEEWRDRGPGAGMIIDWPGSREFALGNEGVSKLVQQTPGAIGYFEYGVAKRAGLAMAALENKAGNFVTPGESAGLATLLSTPMPSNLRAFFPDPSGEDSYPIVTYTWIMLYRKYDSAQKRDDLVGFIRWCLSEGQQFNEQLGYVRLPPDVVSKATRALEGIGIQ